MGVLIGGQRHDDTGSHRKNNPTGIVPLGPWRL
jgi:hypothetical protein